MSDGPTFELPRHVEMAAIDEDVRRMAIERSLNVILAYIPEAMTPPGKPFRCEAKNAWPGTPEGVNRALRVLRHFGMLVEHGDGVVSVKEQA